MTTKQRLRELAGLRPDGHKVLSLYLNLDPSEFPTPKARKTELESLLDVVERAARDDNLTHDQKVELKRDIERVRTWFTSDFDASGTRGAAVFVASGIDLFEVHRLARPIPSEVTIDDSPFIEPLAGMPGGDGYSVLLVNRQLARILAGGRDGMREVVSLVDDVHRWHDQGGWSQARYQRGIQKETKDHLKHAGEELFKLFKRGAAQRLIIGCPDEIRGDVEHHLHSYLRERIAGRLEIDVKASPAAVAREAATIIDRDERERERDWLDRLQSGLGRGDRAVAGLAGTLEALNEQRVEALLVDVGYRDEGYVSPHADFLSTEPGQSPTGDELQKRDDVVESAIERALEQSAELVVVRHHPDLEALGSVGAVLRF
ncbi:MAG TPA: Vms1/Ankzf1 family peptidyl-tRNA hydrolase [Solirubrobacterales bacterium]|nr:Vms1/Ankzf1 family peptidyl-tRNA hydrolase [Solirubrobacterales bacterium]